MTRQEFIRKVKEDQRVQVLQIALFGVVVVSSGAVLSLLFFRWQEAIMAGSALPTGILAGVTAAWCVAAVLSVRFGSQKLLRYPHCRESLGGFPAQVVVASGNCGRCGQRIIDQL